MSSEKTWLVIWERPGLHNFSLKGYWLELCCSSPEFPPEVLLFFWQMESGKSQNCTTGREKKHTAAKLKKSKKTVLGVINSYLVDDDIQLHSSFIEF